MILDIVVVLIILISGFIGIKKGLINVIVKIIGFILAIILACTCYEKLATYLYDNYNFGKNINESVQEFLSEDKAVEDADQEYINLSSILSKFKLDGKINLQEEEKNIDETTTLTEIVANKITGYIMNIISFSAIFLAVILIAAIVGLILSAVCLIPGLKEINKLGGFVIEIILSILKLWIVLALISLLSPLGFMAWIIEQIDKSVIVDFLYHNNILVGVISKIRI